MNYEKLDNNQTPFDMPSWIQTSKPNSSKTHKRQTPLKLLFKWALRLESRKYTYPVTW